MAGWQKVVVVILVAASLANIGYGVYRMTLGEPPNLAGFGIGALGLVLAFVMARTSKTS